MPFEFFRRIARKVDEIVTGRGRLDESLFDDLEELLIQADVNIHTSQRVLADLRTAVEADRMTTSEQVLARIKADLLQVLDNSTGAGVALSEAESPPTVYLVVGINGAGKTTTIAKLAHRLRQRNKRVILAAG
ncbi:MAG TPA: signal recognition particle receptor subunit alpha, partial [Chthonomonadales bacterium]|nr:signal recognition particle receptor subunit alpha [Chthonomonadales bacterium]